MEFCKKARRKSASFSVHKYFVSTRLLKPFLGEGRVSGPGRGPGQEGLHQALQHIEHLQQVVDKKKINSQQIFTTFVRETNPQKVVQHTKKWSEVAPEQKVI